MNLSQQPAPIGIFDSGYGGLTILHEIRRYLPEYDFIYLGDNARTPYGNRSFDVVYEYTLECVMRLFKMGCHLVILACNTASAKALRNIQQNDLKNLDSNRRVLGVIRPTIEEISTITETNHVGLLATIGTVQSCSYPLEIKKLFPDIKVVSQACPMWVPLIENGEYETKGADFFIKKCIDALLKQDNKIDTIILGCTHYPILVDKICQYVPDSITIISQGEWVAKSLQNYLKRHPDMDNRCTKNSTVKYFTTESEEKFKASAANFLHEKIEVTRIKL